MATKIFQCRGIQSRLEQGPFGALLDDYIVELRRVGYPDTHLPLLFRIIRRFSDWVGLNHILLKDLDQGRIEDFWKFHKALRPSHCDFKMLGNFIQFQRQQGFFPPGPLPPEIKCPMEKMLHIFERHLQDERGLSSLYTYQLVRVARAFLVTTFDMTEQTWDQYNGQIVGDYLTQLLKEKCAGEVTTASRHLVQFFKFLFTQGATKLDLSKVVPRPANWRHSRLPIYIGPDKVQKLLDSCDRSTQIGARDYAILVLLSRLGLRGCEVKNLNLSDLHWHEGAMTVRGKGKESKMPMPSEVGEAIASYIKDIRPKTPSRSVFVSVFPPHHGFKRTVSVSGIVKFALDRAKIESSHRGSHLLRHTVANECLKNGASLTEIGHLLRQNHCATTSIYAKVDFTRLAQVTMHWPGGGQ